MWTILAFMLLPSSTSVFPHREKLSKRGESDIEDLWRIRARSSRKAGDTSEPVFRDVTCQTDEPRLGSNALAGCGQSRRLHFAHQDHCLRRCYEELLLRRNPDEASPPFLRTKLVELVIDIIQAVSMTLYS